MTRKTREISEHEGHVDPNKLKIEGLRIESSEKGTDIEDGIPDIISDSKAVIRVFGTGLTENTVITFTHETNTYGGSCQLPSTEKFKVNIFFLFCWKYVLGACVVYALVDDRETAGKAFNLRFYNWMSF